ncbi:MAG TPA: hypothetical protein VLX59_15360, partial [Acidimicrobiales bacterium]|nr:hypothetical protein [Acidimicrobiales bacterium]
MSALGDKACPVDFDRHKSYYGEHFGEIVRDLHAKCPIAWSGTYGGHWVASGYQEVFEIARNAALLSNDHDIEGVRQGYQGISIPVPPGPPARGGFLEMDPPEQRDYRRAIDPYLSPAAVARWKPMVADVTRASLDERIESGTIDFVDDLANVVPAVMTMALLGLPLADWVIYCEPAHAQVYTPPDSPEMARVIEMMLAMGQRMMESIADARRNPRPGIVSALIDAPICGRP